jgi:hypothetical protein
MKNLTLILIAVLTVFGCTKEETPSPLSNNNEFNNISYSSSKKSNLRVLVYIGTGEPGQVEPGCTGLGGNCLPDLIVTGISPSYSDLVGAIENDTQQEFFNTNSYANIFLIAEDHQIQDALEKGHLKIKLERSGNTDYNLFVKPQHEKFEGNKLANKVVLAIPVVN